MSNNVAEREKRKYVRLNKRQAAQAVSHIESAKILKRLTKHMFGEVELSATQIRAAEILLKKTIPDLKALEVSGDEDNPLQQNITVEFIDGTSTK